MIQTHRDSRRRLVAIARGQSGYFTAAQALEAGFSYQSQKYHVDRGNWLRVDRGLFRLPEWPMTAHEDLVRWSLWSGGRAVVSHDSALSLHGIGNVSPGRIHLTVPEDFRRHAPGVVLHRGAFPDGDLERREGFVMTTPLRSLLDAAAGDLDDDQLRIAVSDALEQGLVTRRMLLARVDEFGDRAALRIERALAGEAAE